MKCNFNGLNKTKMENIEELLRDAFRAGMNKGGHQSYFDAPLDETEYIDSIKDKLKLFFIPDVVDCKHDNEIMRQGDGFVYSTCGDCGDEL
jgi:hypothetical protein